jgi:POT family proton-dependent oligopeptide transporter
MNATAPTKQWFGHPRGLSTLFFTEMWERFSYYGMRAILLLYMVAPASSGGLGFATEKGTSVYGWYTMGVYAMSIPGGWIADRFLGLYRSVLVGGIIIALGHFSMVFPSTQMFYLGLCLVVIGTGMLKPNVSSLVGTLYDKEDVRRDAGFSVFYMGINVGAFIAPLICGPLAQRIDWHWGFGAAGIGMTFGVIQYWFGKRYLIGSEAPRTDSSRAREDHSTQRAPAPPLTKTDWNRILVIFILFVFATIFWAAFEQAGSSLNLFADRLTNLHMFGTDVPSSTFQSIQPLFVIALSPLFGLIWLRMGKREPSSPAKFTLGLIFVGIGFLLLVPASGLAQSGGGVKVSPWWLVGVYFFHTVGELCLSPVGLSMVTKLAPERIVGLMMGVWFLSISLGNKLGGYTAGFFERLPLPTLFGAVAATTVAAGLILAVFIKPIRRLMGGVH